MSRRNLGALGLGVVVALVLAQLLPGHAAKTSGPAEAKKGRPAVPTAPPKIQTDAGGLAYVWIPPGTFMMGCSPGESELGLWLRCLDDEKPEHPVAITRGFWVGQTEVTVGAYKRFTQATKRLMPHEPVYFRRPLNPNWANDRMPMVNVTWDDAVAYCRWAGGRLPAEAEWEYAARAGSKAGFYGALDDIAWWAGNSGRQKLVGVIRIPTALVANENGMHEAGQKRPNAFGLYDMLGNVEEWVADWYDNGYYARSPSQDPAGPAAGDGRVTRGGNWLSTSAGLRVSDRHRAVPGLGFESIGFRCVREAP